MIEELRPWQQKREIGVPIAFWSRDQAPLQLLMLAGKNRAPRSLAFFFGKAEYLFPSRVIGQTFSCQRSRVNVTSCACARSRSYASTAQPQANFDCELANLKRKWSSFRGVEGSSLATFDLDSEADRRFAGHSSN